MISPSREVLDSIRRIVRAIRVSSRATEKDLGLSSAQLYVLQQLARLRGEQGISLNELALKTLTHQSSVSVVVTKLVSQGLVKRSRSEDDARKLVISITARGRERVRGAGEPIQKRLISAIESLSGRQQRELAGLLKSVVDHAGITKGPAPLFFEENDR
jgi:DNA-binding MarR family transcriptional regulator